jgi:Monooxygenase subunit B protein.
MKTASRLVAAVVLGIGGIGALAPAAGAHAEAAQDPFLRTQTLAWLETNWSKENIARGEEMVVSGKVRVLTSWPDHTLQPPKTAFLSIVTAGPVMVVRDRRMGGSSFP